MADRNELSFRIKEKALALGFDACGIARAEPLREEKARLLSWLAKGYYGEMTYMARHIEKRLDPTLLVPGSKSVIVVLLDYFYGDDPGDPENPVISRYAVRRDYHKVIRKKLKQLLVFINDDLVPARGWAFVDTAPVLERAWAQKTGLGWIGKNSLLITKKGGSYFFIGELVIDLELAYDNPEPEDYCGNCSRCVEACPTGAILSSRTIDATSCISYWTIEYREEEFPPEVPENFENFIFGCDICQEVCPWNRKSKPYHMSDFVPDEKIRSLTIQAWEQMTEAGFNSMFSGTPVMRAGYRNMIRNLEHQRRKENNRSPS